MMYEYWLASVHGVSAAKKRALRERLRCAEEIYNIEEKGLYELDVLTEKEIQAILEAKKKDCRKEYSRLAEQEIGFVPYFADGYPRRLKDIQNPPYALYVKGRLPEEERFSAAIVGARRCTHYGEEMALRYGEQLAGAGVQVISGMARGIDGAGQRGALNGGGFSCGVLGSGVLSERKLRALYGLAERRGTSLRTGSGDEASSGTFPGEKPHNQCAFGCCACDRGKGEKRVFDYRRYGVRAGKGCICIAGACYEPFEQRVPPSDSAGGGDTDFAGGFVRRSERSEEKRRTNK